MRSPGSTTTTECELWKVQSKCVASWSERLADSWILVLLCHLKSIKASSLTWFLIWISCFNASFGCCFCNFNWRSFHSTHRKSWFFDIRCVDVLGRLEIFQKIKSPCVLCELWMYPNSWRCTTCMRQCFQPKSGKFEVRPFKKCQDNYYQILFIYVDRVKKGRWWLSMWNSLLQVLLRTPLPRSVL